MARRDRRDDDSGPAWLRAKNALREVLAPWVPSGDLGFVKWLGEGASRVASVRSRPRVRGTWKCSLAFGPEPYGYTSPSMALAQDCR